MSTKPEGIWAPYEAFYIEAMLSNTGSAMASLERVSDVIEEVEHDRCGGTLDSIDPPGPATQVCASCDPRSY
jgi:hypothetical protein